MAAYYCDVLIGFERDKAAGDILPLLNDSAKVNLCCIQFHLLDRTRRYISPHTRKAIQTWKTARDLASHCIQPERRESSALMDYSHGTHDHVE